MVCVLVADKNGNPRHKINVLGVISFQTPSDDVC